MGSEELSVDDEIKGTGEIFISSRTGKVRIIGSLSIGSSRSHALHAITNRFRRRRKSVSFASPKV